jgi:hypothetical protein
LLKKEFCEEEIDVFCRGEVKKQAFSPEILKLKFYRLVPQTG